MATESTTALRERSLREPAPREPRLPSEADAAKRRKPQRLSAGTVAPIVLAVLAAGFGYAALQDRSAMARIVVASTYIPAGSAVGWPDVRLVSVHAADQAQSRGLLSPAELSRQLVAAVALQPGEAVTESEVKKAAGRSVGEMSIAVPLQQAAGGRLSPGDLVDVIATSAGGARYVAQDLRVVSVAAAGAASGVLGAANGSYFVVVAVDKQVALRVAAAIGAQGSGSSNGQIELVRSDGERTSSQVVYDPPPAPTPSESAGAQIGQH